MLMLLQCVLSNKKIPGVQSNFEPYYNQFNLAMTPVISANYLRAHFISTYWKYWENGHRVNCKWLLKHQSSLPPPFRSMKNCLIQVSKITNAWASIPPAPLNASNEQWRGHLLFSYPTVIAFFTSTFLASSQFLVTLLNLVYKTEQFLC